MQVASRITRVTVHARGALITREAELPALDDGPCQLELEGVTVLAQPGSVRAALPGSSREVLAVASALAVPATPVVLGAPLAALREVERRLERLQDERARLTNQAAALALDALKPYLRGGGVDLAARAHDALAASALARDLSAELEERIGVLEVDAERLGRERDALRLAAQQASSSEAGRAGQGHPTRRITVDTVGSGAAPRLEVSYVIWAARWWPLYTLRLTMGEAGASPRATLLCEALVAQLGGEDWHGVELELATSDLAFDARLPELASLRLGRAQAAPRRGYRPMEPGLERMFAGYDRAAPPELAWQTSPPQPKAPPRQHKGRPPAEPPVGGKADMPMDALMAPSFAPQQMGAKKSRGLLGGLGGLLGAGGGGVGAPAAAAAPPPAPRMAMPKTMMMSMDRGEADEQSEGFAAMASEEEAMEPAPAAGLEPSGDWLDFDGLMMPAVNAFGRGRLQRVAGPAHGDDGERQRIEALAPPLPVHDPMVSRGLFDHRYRAAGLAEIPSDAAPHRVSVAAAEAPCQVRFLCVPREIAEVYREAVFENPFDAPLLPGPADVVLDGTLLSSTELPRVDRKGQLAIGLGVEERVRVARNARVREDTAGLLGGQLVVTHDISVELRSALARPITVEVLDRIPVSDHDEVEVTRVSESHKGEDYSQSERGVPLRGGRRWQVALTAAGTATLESSYRLNLSGKHEVVGGNRRE